MSAKFQSEEIIKVELTNDSIVQILGIASYCGITENNPTGYEYNTIGNNWIKESEIVKVIQ